MMFLPHLILANHFNEKGFCAYTVGMVEGETEHYLGISDGFDRCEMMEKTLLFLSWRNFSHLPHFDARSLARLLVQFLFSPPPTAI